jgi:hypothetical protein
VLEALLQNSAAQQAKDINIKSYATQSDQQLCSVLQTRQASLPMLAPEAPTLCFGRH